MVKKINEKQFEEVLKDSAAIVDFSATWCGPCSMLAPVLDRLSEEYEGRAAFYKVDVDECPGLAQKYMVVSIPHIVALKNGEVVSTQTGFVPAEVLKGVIDKAL